MLEIRTLSSTHRTVANLSESTIDRCFITLPSYDIPFMEILLTADDAPLGNRGWHG